MKPMTTHQRMQCMFQRKEADRAPITDSPWGATLERWRKEGLPADVPWSEYFGLDRFLSIGADNSPRYPVQKLETTDEYTVTKSPWGATLRNWTHRGGVPEFLDFTVVDRDSWAKAKARMTPSDDRINWDYLKEHFPRARQQGAWISAGFWFGFDVTHSWFLGTERVLEAIIEDPQWLSDIFNTMLDLDIALFDRIWEAGYHFDDIRWPDDMGYKGHQFFSVNTYRDLLKPVHKRAADWAHAKGIKVELHSCGDVRPLIPELIDIGIDMLNPIEVKAGMDPIALKHQYGDKLAFHGGLNAALYWEPEKLYQHMREVIPAMKRSGGYVVSTDHSVPDSVSLEDFRRFVELAKELARY
jgi:uroporphyrinogen decarboxylase